MYPIYHFCLRVLHYECDKKKLTCHFSKRKMLEKLYLRKNKDSSMVDDDKG